MSLTLNAFNIMLKVSSWYSFRKFEKTDNFAESFKEHASQMDVMISRFINNYDHPMVKTDDEHKYWIGDLSKTKRHILLIHGGGFSVHLPKAYRYWADRLATMNDASVLVLDYPLAPEHPFPEGLDACLNAYRWMIEDQNIDPKTIVVGGDSAGASLTMSTLLRIKQEGLPQPACAFMLSPGLDLTLTSPSYTENKSTDYLGTIGMLKNVVNAYVPNGDLTNPMVSPIYAECDGLPPVLLHASNVELLRDDCVRFYEKFKNNMQIELEIWDKVPHCHQIYGFLPEAQEARDKIQKFISNHC